MSLQPLFAVPAGVGQADSLQHAGKAATTMERILTSYPPVLEHVLLHLPTSSILRLAQVNRRLREFLHSYPLAWNTLSFRTFPTAQNILNPTGFDGSDISELVEVPVAFNYLLRSLIPHSTSLARLELDNTCVDGVQLTSKILEQRRGTLKHLSVRGCKRVSLRYHILPWLEVETSIPHELAGGVEFALKSLYVYRCRHHRRRPYLPSSLIRRDSDSRPTHQLIELCHRMGIWTDTAWCPTPGPRCYRRKDYYMGHNPAEGPTEVWVPFDRLWRSQNYIGKLDDGLETDIAQLPKGYQRSRKARIWEEQDCGHEGEQLGCGLGAASGEGKEIPMHQRRSHKIFVEDYKCDACGEPILERCEQCSVRFHCMGCRKTLCASCAFDKPIKRKRRRLSNLSSASSEMELLIPSTPTQMILSASKRRAVANPRGDRYWWAPGADRSPNVMTEESDDPLSSDDDEPTNPAQTLVPHAMRHPRLNMQWCCLRPAFSGGGGIAFHGTPCGDNVKASPLPKGQGYEDPSFPRAPQRTRPTHPLNEALQTSPTPYLVEQTLGMDPGEFDISTVFEQAEEPSSEVVQKFLTPRSLCEDCYTTTAWRVLCGGCKLPLCIDHDVKTLKVRRCGYRRLPDERRTVQAVKRLLLEGKPVPKHVRDNAMASFYGKWNPIISGMIEGDEVRRLLGKWTPITSSAFQSEDTSDYDLPQAVYTHPSLRTDQLDAPEPAVDSLSPSQERPHPPCPTTQPTHSSHDLLSTSCRDDGPSRPLRRSNSTPHIQARPRAMSDESSLACSNLMIPSRWIGCGRYFCPATRGHGDLRPRCMADTAVRACTDCGLHVCDACIDAAPKQCTCTNCQRGGFRCPNCCRSLAARVDCCWEYEELLRQREAALEAARQAAHKHEIKVKWDAEAPERAEADESAVGLNEFLSGLLLDAAAAVAASD